MHQLLEQVRAAGFFSAALLPAENASDDFQAFYNHWLNTKPEEILPYLNQTEAKFQLDKIFPGTRTLLVALHSYKHPVTEQELRSAPYKIARYAWGRDYHKVLRNKLSQSLQTAGLAKHAFRIIVDSTPVNERYYARLASLGFVGRNGMLIHPQAGSFFFIAMALLQQEYPENNASFKDSKVIPADLEKWCGQCQLCVKACPTQALVGNGTMRAERCLSMLTIENNAAALQYPAGTKKHNWIFGCDICQNVCPYNRTPAYIAADDFAHTSIAQKISGGMVPADREALYGTPFLRAGIDNLRRNLRAVDLLNEKNNARAAPENLNES